MDERIAVDRASRFRWDGAVPKYDAFGREIGENTLAGLGGSNEPAASAEPVPSSAGESWASATPTAEPSADWTAAPSTQPADGWTDAPAPEAPVVSFPDAPPRPINVRRARGLGCLVGLVILAAVVAGPVIAIVSVVSDAGDAIDEVTGVFDDVPTDDPAPPPDPAVGITGRSMIAPGNVERALGQLDGAKRVGRMTIWPERLETDVIRGRRATDVTFSAEGGVTRGEPEAYNEALGTIPVADIDPTAPARLVRNAAKRYGVRERGINYLIGSEDVFSGSGHRWIAYFKNGVYVQGDERGRVIRRID
jgi:hypothetical protein